MAKREQILIYDQAAEWLLRAEEGALDGSARAALQSWREQSAAHEQAWRQALALSDQLDHLPQQLVRGAINRSDSPARRAAIRKLLMLALAAPVAGGTYWGITQRHWLADMRTQVGEQRHYPLAAAGAVLVASAGALVVGVVMLLPPLWKLVGGAF